MTGCAFTAMSSEIRGRTLFSLASIAILALLPLVIRDQLGDSPITYDTHIAGAGQALYLQ